MVRKMEAIPAILLSVFALWTVFTVIMIIIMRNDLVAFFRSTGFIVIAVGYIIIVSIYPILQKFFPEDDTW